MTQPERYTAIAYFHGIGAPQRYEEISRLVDSIDAYLSPENGSDAKIRGIELHYEASRLERPAADLSYVAASLTRPNKRPLSLRFYEGYWSPLTAEGIGQIKVVLWLLIQVIAPFRNWFVPWRGADRLRRASLFGQWRRLAERFSHHELITLLASYRSFGSKPARREFRSGRFFEFLAFLDRQHKQRPRLAENVKEIAWRWWFCNHRMELFNLFRLFTVLAVVVDLCMLVAIAVKGVIFFYRVGAFDSVDGFMVHVGEVWMNLLISLAFLAVIPAMSRFLRHHAADVMFWATFKENDLRYEKRKRVLNAAFDLIEHILRDPNCERLVVVGHSLGTAVAFDALRQVGRYNEAHGNVLDTQKISHFITLGSPIDRIHYFFESSLFSGRHRFNRLTEDSNRDIGAPPFVESGLGMRWINYWDSADQISGPLYTPLSKRSAGGRLEGARIENIRVQSCHYPRPVRSHSAYFENFHVLKGLYAAIVGASRRVPVGAPDEGPTVDVAMPPLSPALRTAGFVSAVGGAWLMLLLEGSLFLGVYDMVDYLIWLTGAALGCTYGFLAVGVLRDRRSGHLLKP